MRKRSEPDLLASVLTTATTRGVIDAAQAATLQSIAAEMGAGQRTIHSSGDVAADGNAARVPGAPTEERRAFNPVIIAYSAGALLVLFALGWFLVDRWRDLGAAGVLAVAAGYAGAFALASRELGRRGFRVASGLSATLAIGMTPVWTFAILRLAGEWPTPVGMWRDPLVQYKPWVASRWIILELTTIAVALMTIRRVRFFTIALPIAAALVGLLLHIGEALGDPRLSWYVRPYYLCVVGTLVLGIAYLVDQRQGPGDGEGEDYALWFYIGGSVALAGGYLQLWDQIGWWRHALPVIAFALAAAAVYLRRRVLLIGAGIAAFGYLGYLAFDVFEDVLALPVALAGVGLLVIVATVWMQRRFPVLVARAGANHTVARKALPGGVFAAFGPVAIALTAMLFSVEEARRRTEDRDRLTTHYRRRARGDAAADRAAQGAPAAVDTTGGATPGRPNR